VNSVVLAAISETDARMSRHYNEREESIGRKAEEEENVDICF
jgi:hypothetical protein